MWFIFPIIFEITFFFLFYFAVTRLCSVKKVVVILILLIMFVWHFGFNSVHFSLRSIKTNLVFYSKSNLHSYFAGTKSEMNISNTKAIFYTTFSTDRNFWRENNKNLLHKKAIKNNAYSIHVAFIWPNEQYSKKVQKDAPLLMAWFTTQIKR